MLNSAHSFRRNYSSQVEYIYIYIYSIKLIAPEKTWRILSDENDNMYIVLQEMSNIFYPHT